MSFLSSIKDFLSKRYLEVAVAFAAIAVGGVLYAYFSKFHGGWSPDQDTWGQFGDFVGGTLNPLLGFISVVVLVSTLNLQRVELKEARAVVKEGNELLESQLRAIHLQSLEVTFFKVMEEFEKNEIVLACKKVEHEKSLFSAVYCYVSAGEQKGILDKGFKSKGNYFRFMTEGAVDFGEFKYVLVGKIINLLEIAEGLNNNQIHYSLIQSAVGPALMSAAIHFINVEHPELYPRLAKAKRTFWGINPELVFLDVVAKDFLKDSSYEKYVKNKDHIITRRERILKLHEQPKIKS